MPVKETKIKLTPTQEAIRDEIIGKLGRHYGRTLDDATKSHIYKATALTVRDKMMEGWTNYRRSQRKAKNKELFYLSFEFLMGRALGNNLINLGLTKDYEKALNSLGCSLYEIEEAESDAGLGNGGLGRLAACFLDSLTALDYPAFGCGIRYEYGLFRQRIIDGYQIEMPDNWLDDGSVWEIARPEEKMIVRFGGNVNTTYTDKGMTVTYENTTNVVGVPYDMPIVGYNSKIVNTLRLWSAHSEHELDMRSFSGGDYVKAVEERALAETLSKVLYPEDNHEEGKALRLKQQYFFVSCTIQWIISRYKRHHNGDLSNLADDIAIHINDTHPAIAIPEMMRILMDEEGYGWDDAWEVVNKVFGYTNHTIMSEALEKWPMDMFARLFPRLWMIVDEINNRLKEKLVSVYGNDWGKINYMSVVAHNYINMANLCLASCHAINGVSGLHTDILKKDVFRDYYNLTPEKFVSITNGITFRRWVGLANPELSKLLTKYAGKDWLKKPEKLKNLEEHLNNQEFLDAFDKMKREKKVQLAEYIKEHNGIEVNPDSIFDVQVKRLHEYKRQLLNVLHILYLYNKIKQNPNLDIYPHTFIFGAKASPGYARAKLIIKLINDVAELINNDESIGGKIKVVFIENYGVSLAQKIIPAADVSEQISTAGKEASGTGNMKFMANGALTVGTLDGANVEMTELVGEDNIFLFGLKSDEVREVRITSQDVYSTNADIKKVLDMLINGEINKNEPKLYYDLYQALLFGDHQNADEYMVLRDFESYILIHEKIDKEYRNRNSWIRKSVINTANSSFFSSDRTIKEYSDKIWHLKSVKK